MLHPHHHGTWTQARPGRARERIGRERSFCRCYNPTKLKKLLANAVKGLIGIIVSAVLTADRCAGRRVPARKERNRYKLFAGSLFANKAGLGYIERFQRSVRLTPDE